MVTFPNAKINLGLNILSVLPNGYHTIDSVLYPIPWCDILEIVPSSGAETTLHVSGRQVDCPLERNLVYRAYKIMCQHYNIPPVDIYLRKVIPDGAGLGGGSSDAAFALRMLRDMFCKEVTDDELARLAAGLGADCPFFIFNRAMAVSNIGTDMEPCDVSLAGMQIAVIKPRRSVSTAEAYAGAAVGEPVRRASRIVADGRVDEWRTELVNDFEPSVFGKVPECGTLKERLYALGAVYAQMSGSGSAVFGLFSQGGVTEDEIRGISGDADVFVSALG